MPSNRKASARRKSSKAKSSRGGRGRSRRGLFGVLGRLFYWCFVLAIWGGIAVAGVVVYYGAKMPAATTWSIPDRAPNIKIVSADGQLLANRGMSGGEAVGFELNAEKAWISRVPAQFFKVNARSEERRVGKECRSRWSPYH